MEGGIEDAKKRAKGILEAKKTRSPPEEITAFRREFGEILTALEKTLVVFIDNLDRCNEAVCRGGKLDRATAISWAIGRAKSHPDGRF